MWPKNYMLEEGADQQKISVVGQNTQVFAHHLALAHFCPRLHAEKSLEVMALLW